jgi:hypothetical protein
VNDCLQIVFDKVPMYFCRRSELHLLPAYFFANIHKSDVCYDFGSSRVRAIEFRLSNEPDMYRTRFLKRKSVPESRSFLACLFNKTQNGNQSNMYDIPY